MISQYGLGEVMRNVISLIYTRVSFPTARLVRIPFRLRGGKKRLTYGPGLTTGYACRFDLAGDGVALKMGSNVKINDRVHIVAHESVDIGNDVLMASNIFITDTSHGSYCPDSEDVILPPDERPLITNPVSIGNRVWVGEGACILPGVTIGSGCVVGANAVVTKSFPDNTVLAGVPAKAIKRWNSVSEQWESA